MQPSSIEPSFLATRRGKLTLALLCGIAFLDFVDASIVNIALPSIRSSLHFSVEGLTMGAERATCSPTVGSCCSAAAPPIWSAGVAYSSAASC